MSKDNRPGTPGILGSAGIFLAVGATSILVLVSSCARSTQGALRSTRLQWEERTIELDKAVTKAQAEGKLRATPTRIDPSHE